MRGVHGSVELDQRRDEPRPAGLVTGAQTGTVVTVEVLVKEDVVAPVGIGLEFPDAAVDRAQDAALGHAEMTRTGRVHRRQQFGAPAQALLDVTYRARHALPLLLFDHGGGAQREEPHQRTYLEPRGAAIGKPQDVVVEAV